MSKMGKETPRFQVKLHGIQSCFDALWTGYGRVVLRFPWLILLSSALLSIGLSVYFLLFVDVRPFDQMDFFLPNGPAMRNARRIQKIFGNDRNLRAHQQLDLYPALDVIIRRAPSSSDTNMLNLEVIDELHRLNAHVQSFRIGKTRPLNYSRLCAVINHACVVEGNYLLSKKFRDEALRLPYLSSGIYIDSTHGANGISTFIFGKSYRTANVSAPEVDYEDDEEEVNGESGLKTTPMTEIVSYVPVFRLRYSLNVTTKAMSELAIQWEREVLRSLNDEFSSKVIEFSASTSTAISDSVSRQAREEGIFLVILFSVFFLLVCSTISIEGNRHTSVGYLSLFGIIGFVLSSGATFGLLTVLKISIIEPMALLVFVVAIVDCIRCSIVCGVYHRTIGEEHLLTSARFDLERVFLTIIRLTRSCFLSSTLITLSVYLILALVTPIPCTRVLSSTFVVYMAMNSFIHWTFFSSCLVVNLRRLHAHRHSLSCLPLSTEYTLRSAKESARKRFTCLSTMDKVFKRFLLGFLCLFSLISLIFCLWLVLSIDTRLFDDRFLPRNATSLRSYMKSQMEDYNIGPVIIFTIPEPIDYEKRATHDAIQQLVSQCFSEPTTNDFKLVWIDHEKLSTLLYSSDPLPMRVTPYSVNDLILRQEKNRTTIDASRFYCQLKSIKGDREDLRSMSNLYAYANQSSLSSIFPYSFVFPHYESLGQLRLEIYLLLLSVTLSSFVVSLLVFLSLTKAFLFFAHFLALLASSFACLYVVHDFTLNFANALWFYFIPVIYLDIFLHGTSNIRRSKWLYNRVLLSLLVALILFRFFPVQTYLYEILSLSLIYQTSISLLLINVCLPSWFYIVGSMRNTSKNKNGQLTSLSTVNESNQPLTVTSDLPNLVSDAQERTPAT